MTKSYAGDRVQQLAQAWLVATFAGSALAVGGITALGSLPLLLLPLGGVVAAAGLFFLRCSRPWLPWQRVVSWGWPSERSI